jgi:hypothetical protein
MANIKLLTYNLYWKAMTGNHPACKSDICINNVADMIDKNDPYDFITFQEAANYEKLISLSKSLSNMSYRIHKSGPEYMITFWNPDKYNFDSIINGEFKAGRPWQAVFFKENICLINIHMGHFNKWTLIFHLNNMIKKIKESMDIKKYRIIIAGDFNYVINHINKEIGFGYCISIQGLRLYIKNTFISTCCQFPGKPTLSKHFDHVIDSLGTPFRVYSPVIQTPASDHNPIIALLAVQKGGVYEKYIKYKTKYINLLANNKNN